MTTRRHFFRILPLAGSAGLFASSVSAQAQPAVDPQESQAKALGYVKEADKLDKAKAPSHLPGQACSNCALYQGKAGAADGPCPLFGGRLVVAKGWCTAYVKKP